MKNKHSAKRLYLGLAVGAVGTLLGLGLLIAELLQGGRHLFSVTTLGTLAAMIPVAGALVLIAGVVGFLFFWFGWIHTDTGARIVQRMINLIFPVVIYAGKIFRVAKEQVEASFVEINNFLVQRKIIRVAAARVLVLAPHCLQQASCDVRITNDVHNCRRCGRCPMGGLLKLTEELGVQLAVVGGGTAARKQLRALRPSAVVAIACERDLTFGIQEVFPLPVVGVLNERPEGPCHNTLVDLERVREAVRKFIG